MYAHQGYREVRLMDGQSLTAQSGLSVGSACADWGKGARGHEYCLDGFAVFGHFPAHFGIGRQTVGIGGPTVGSGKAVSATSQLFWGSFNACLTQA